MAFVLRALFWFTLVCFFVPFESFDLRTGEIRLDNRVLADELAHMTSFCDRNEDACILIGEIVEIARHEGSQLVETMGVALKGRAP